MTPEMAALLKQAEAWSPEMKAKAAEAVRKKLSITRRAWYCDRRRTCDGKPHRGFDYPHARGSQWPPADRDWLLWFILAGRGFGKTRTGAEWVLNATKHVSRIAMIGRRGIDVRITLVEGDSGLIACCENAGLEYVWRPSTKEFIIPERKSTIFGFSAEEPDALRGPQFGAAWMDEPAHMDNLQEVWDNLLFGLRLPGLPGGAKAIATGTPLGIDWIKEQLKSETTRVTRGATYDNLDNLDPTFRKSILDKYEGTRKGRQELYGEVLMDVEGALWSNDMFTTHEMLPEDMDRIVVSIDPAGSANKRSDETGIVVVGSKGRNGYVFEDATDKYTPSGWAGKAISLFEKYKADAIVAEKNFGGDMVKTTIQHELEARNVEARIIITHAARSKELRAEPIVGLYEQQRVFHTRGLEALENEMTMWVPGVGRSPNRIDALVHGMAEVIKGNHKGELPILTNRPLPTGGAPRLLGGFGRTFKRNPAA